MTILSGRCWNNSMCLFVIGVKNIGFTGISGILFSVLSI